MGSIFPAWRNSIMHLCFVHTCYFGQLLFSYQKAKISTVDRKVQPYPHHLLKSLLEGPAYIFACIDNIKKYIIFILSNKTLLLKITKNLTAKKKLIAKKSLERCCLK